MGNSYNTAAAMPSCTISNTSNTPGARSLYRGIPRSIAAIALMFVTGCGDGSDRAAFEPPKPVPPPPKAPIFNSFEALGESLFFDTNLSQDRTQACSTCHNPDRAFIDDRLDDKGEIRAVSLGDDGISLGDRNTPSASYAMITPAFHHGSHERFNTQQPDYTGFIGGLFLDGRALGGLLDQAKGPPLNPIEMGMSDEAAMVQRLLENPGYEVSFKALFGDNIFDDTKTAYEAMAKSIAEFEKTGVFAPFDSKYDRSLTGDYIYDPASKAALGKSLFFSAQFTNCASCHQLHPNSNKKETFSSYEYHNIGVPINTWVRAINGRPADFIDTGLLDNPEVNDAAEEGKYKVPSLRNVAVTEPYMHNGVFRNLETVMKFYDHFLTNSEFTLNPETGAPWRDAEVPQTVAFSELEDGRRLKGTEIDALVCFLRTLTDARYEHLIKNKGIECSG